MIFEYVPLFTYSLECFSAFGMATDFFVDVFDDFIKVLVTYNSFEGVTLQLFQIINKCVMSFNAINIADQIAYSYQPLQNYKYIYNAPSLSYL